MVAACDLLVNFAVDLWNVTATASRSLNVPPHEAHVLDSLLYEGSLS